MLCGTEDMAWPVMVRQVAYCDEAGRKQSALWASVEKRTAYETQRYLRAFAALKTSRMLFKSSTQWTAGFTSVCTSELNFGFKKKAVIGIKGTQYHLTYHLKELGRAWHQQHQPEQKGALCTAFLKNWSDVQRLSMTHQKQCHKDSWVQVYTVFLFFFASKMEATNKIPRVVFRISDSGPKVMSEYWPGESYTYLHLGCTYAEVDLLSSVFRLCKSTYVYFVPLILPDFGTGFCFKNTQELALKWRKSLLPFAIQCNKQNNIPFQEYVLVMIITLIT